jgi:predicted metal-dependent hydrolase
VDRSKDGSAVPSLTAFRLHAKFVADVDGSTRRIALSWGVLHYRFVRARRRTIGIIVHRGEVEARAPRQAALAEVEAFLRLKERWIAKRLTESPPEPPALRWTEGELLPVLGRTARLTAAAGAAGTARLSGDRLELPSAPPEHWRELTIAWLRGTALDLFGDRISHYAALLGVGKPSLGLSSAQTQWGSCRRAWGEAGRILLNWRLVHLPPYLTDYVVVHELAHLREHNHSPRFWTLVAQLYPDYLSARRELNRLGRTLPRL